MSAYTFDNTFTDLYYELNDSEIANDVYMIYGASGSESMKRGYDAASIAKYGRRTRRLPNPIVVDAANAETLITEHLDRNCEPAARLKMTVAGDTAAMIEQLLTRKISDKVTVVCTTMGMSEDFIIEGIKLFTEPSRVIYGVFDLVDLRAGE